MPAFRPALALTFALLAMPAAVAQRPSSIEERVGRVEKELRAVQRKVFPGGDQAFTTPDIAAPQTPPPVAGMPASAPINDLTARVDALEKSVTQLTAQVEEQGHRLSVLSAQVTKDRQEFTTRLQLVEQSGAAQPTAVAPGEPTTLPAPAAATRPAPVKTPPKPAPEPAATEDTTGPAASGDPAEDAYMAGYRLWTQKKYSEAQTALRAVATKYPKHRRASYAQNLLGRAYLDAGRPANAAEAFAANYQTNPRGERAPDSLFYLGESLVKLNKPTDACRVYDEFTAAYGSTASASLKDRVAAARKTAKCK
ncbi:tetratricopeptide repeat protein [Sphingomonas sp.]|uniref:tetratricopeptide repeat protein n=1 Tax=Sphingomonas sp. TaxID=28214 RepID=UPI003B3B4216